MANATNNNPAFTTNKMTDWQHHVKFGSDLIATVYDGKKGPKVDLTPYKGANRAYLPGIEGLIEEKGWSFDVPKGTPLDKVFKALEARARQEARPVRPSFVVEKQNVEEAGKENGEWLPWEGPDRFPKTGEVLTSVQEDQLLEMLDEGEHIPFAGFQDEPEDVEVEEEEITPCMDCGKTGVYTRISYYTGKRISLGECFRCNGKGHQTPEDQIRNEYYDTHRMFLR